MKKSKALETARVLAGKNAQLMQSAMRSRDAIVNSAHTELEKLDAQIAAIKPADALLNPLKSEEYQQAVFRRASLMKLVAQGR